MSQGMNSEDDPQPCPRAAMAGPASWYDERLLDHHLEELLAALEALAGLGPPAPPEGSA
jgi:hypothetical protein